METESIIDYIKTGNNTLLAKKLDSDPNLANLLSPAGISILQLAAYYRNSEAVQLIKKHKDNLDLFEATCIGESNQVIQLLDSDSKQIKAISKDGFTLLGLACFFGHFGLVQELIQRSADPNIPSENSFKVSPLHSACAISNLEIAELLLLNGAEVNAKQLNGVTPLHSAAHNGALNLVKLLIRYGANVNSKMENGETPISMAKSGKFNEIVDFLISKGANH